MNIRLIYATDCLETHRYMHVLTYQSMLEEEML